MRLESQYKNHVGFWIRKLASWNFDRSVIFKSISDLDSKMPKIYLLQSKSFPKLTNNGKVCFKVNSWQSHHSTRILLYKTWYINQDISGLKNVRSHFYVFFDVILRNCRFSQAILWNSGNKILNAEASPKNWHIREGLKNKIFWINDRVEDIWIAFMQIYQAHYVTLNFWRYRYRN